MPHNNSINVYKALIEKADDKVLGMVAFSFYKEQEIQFIKNQPDDIHKSPKKMLTKRKEFHSFAMMEEQLQKYINDADNMLMDFSDDISNQRIEDLQEEMRAEVIISELDNSLQKINSSINKVGVNIRSSKPHYMVGVSQSLVASIFTIIFIGFAIFVVWANNFSFKDALNAVAENQKVIIKEENKTLNQKDNK